MQYYSDTPRLALRYFIPCKGQRKAALRKLLYVLPRNAYHNCTCFRLDDLELAFCAHFQANGLGQNNYLWAGKMAMFD